MSYLRAIYFWTFLTFWTVLLFAAILVHRTINTLFGNRSFANACHGYASLWGRGIFAAMPAWKLEISGKENLPAPGQPVVIAANHESMADIWALFGTRIQFRWLSKAEVFKIPLVGHAMRWAEYIPIKRGNKESHVAALAASAKQLENGVSMAFFPEGTRSHDGTLRPFKIGAFRLAQQSGVPVLPVALKGAGRLMRKGSALPYPATVKLMILEPTQPLPGETLEQYADRVRDKIVEAHSRL